MKKPIYTVIILAICFVATYFCFINTKTELAPIEDRDTINLRVTGPEGFSFEMMDEYMFQLQDLVRETLYENEIESLIANTSPSWGGGGSNSGSIRVMLTPADQRQRSQQELVNILSTATRQLSSARVMIAQPATIKAGRGGGGGNAVQFVIQAQNLDKLREFLPQYMDKAQQDEHFSFVDVNLKFTKPEVRIEIDRDKARTLHVSVQDIAQTLQLGLSGSRYGFFVMNGKQYQVIGQLDRTYRNKPLDISSLYVRNTNGELIQMDNLIRMKEDANPPQLYRYNRFVSATITAQLSPGITLGEGVDALQQIAGDVLDETFRTELSGQAKEMRDSSGSMGYALILALVLIYLVLAAQFESFRDPFIILFTVPLALTGAMISLWYFKQTLNIFSEIGIIMLIGLVTKNGILIVEFANQKKALGLNVKEAVRQAASQRFRPILMTSLATILGILPIAMAWGAGSESRVSMGIAVVGGMTLSTILTLFVVPVVYTWISNKKKEVSNVSV